MPLSPPPTRPRASPGDPPAWLIALSRAAAPPPVESSRPAGA
jgi:hypothetical protein